MSSRDLLDFLGRETLVRLMRERELAPVRENDERRKSLAHSYRGDVDELILSLTRQELVDVFRDLHFDQGGGEVYLSNPGKYHLDELQAFAIRVFAGRRVRIPDDFTPVIDDDEDERDDGDGDDDDQDDEPDDDDDDEPAANILRVDSEQWSRPRMIARILRQLGEDVPQRLRTPRFQVLIGAFLGVGIEACLADDPGARVLTADDESPGIAAKLRLRKRAGEQTSPGLDLSAPAHEPKRPAAQPFDGGPRIVLQAGEKPIPQQVARLSDYNLAVLRLQFLTAVPSAERGLLAAWPDGYLVAATRGLSLRDQERSLLRAYAAGLCVGNHSPFDAIPRLSQVLSPAHWDELLIDFQALNPFQPELVQAIVNQVAPVTAPRSQPGSWREAPPTPPDLAAPERPPTYPQQPQPQAAAGRRETAADTVRDDEGSNKRDLGALTGMFDDE